MTDIQRQLSGVVEAYYTELMNTDTSAVDGYRFSKKHKARMNEAFKLLDAPKKSKTHIIRRRVIIALIAAALIGTVTAVAFEPVRRFFTNTFSDHTEVRPAVSGAIDDKHKEKIERKYSVDIPSGYTLDEEASVETELSINKIYYNSDRSKRIDFSQHVSSRFGINIDNEYAQLETKLDKYGQEILVYNHEDVFVTIIWDNGEYTFELEGESITEAELMEIYYSMK